MADEARVEGLENVTQAINSLGDMQRLERALSLACALVERTAKQKAPKNNGELQRSIASRIEIIDGSPVGVVYTPLEYAPYVEFGTGLFAEEEGRADVPWCYQDDEGEWHSTSGMHPQPFLRPALQENRKQILRLLKGGKGK